MRMRPLSSPAGGRSFFYPGTWRATAGSFCLGLTAMSSTELPAGIWGGEQVRFEVADRQAVLQLGCAAAYLPAPLRLDAKGRFSVQGRYSAFSGGPSAAPEVGTPKPDTRFDGELKGDRLTLTVRRPGGVERYELVRGLQSKVIGCY
jgi:hypothetical protein